MFRAASRARFDDTRRRVTVALVLLLFVSMNFAGWSHAARFEHVACDLHGTTCHGADGAEDREQPGAPEEHHDCDWHEFLRSSGFRPDVVQLTVVALEAEQPAEVAPPQLLRVQEDLYLLAPKGSPPLDRS